MKIRATITAALLCLLAVPAFAQVTIRPVLPAGQTPELVEGADRAKIELTPNGCQIKGIFDAVVVDGEEPAASASLEDAACQWEVAFTKCEDGDIAFIDVTALHTFSLAGTWGLKGDNGVYVDATATTTSLARTTELNAVLGNAGKAFGDAAYTEDQDTFDVTLHEGSRLTIPDGYDTRTVFASSGGSYILGAVGEAHTTAELLCGQKVIYDASSSMSGKITSWGPVEGGFGGTVMLAVNNTMAGAAVVLTADGEVNEPMELIALDPAVDFDKQKKKTGDVAEVPTYSKLSATKALSVE